MANTFLSQGQNLNVMKQQEMSVTDGRELLEPFVPMPGSTRHMQRWQGGLGLLETKQAGVPRKGISTSLAEVQELAKVFKRHV